jgi:hypothetical protein
MPPNEKPLEATGMSAAVLSVERSAISGAGFAASTRLLRQSGIFRRMNPAEPKDVFNCGSLRATEGERPGCDKIAPGRLCR